MRLRRFQWEAAAATARAIRGWSMEAAPEIDLGPIEREVREEGDAALRRLTERFDATDQPLEALRVERAEADQALAGIDAGLRESLELAAANVRTVAEAQLGGEPKDVRLPQGQTIRVGEVPVSSVGVYAPGGGAAYPSSVLMGCIPARVAGVGSLALATPPGPDGRIDPLVLAAASLCEVDEIHPIGGAQAIFALAYGTSSVRPVDVIAGPGNAWVTEAKRAVYGQVGIDSLAGPSELMLVAGHASDPEWAALDLCAQAEHGGGGVLLAVSVEEAVLEAIGQEAERLAGARPGVGDSPLALLQVPDLDDAVDLANAFAPEHLELLEDDAALLGSRVTGAGCVFAGRFGATAFGDYVAGSNHILPTGGTGRFSGPLSPRVFRRATATVEVTAEAASKLAPHVDALARAEGFPVHGESAMIRVES